MRPTELRLGHRRYRIEWPETIGPRSRGGESLTIQGDTDHLRHVVRIATKGRAKPVQQETLLHEILHCAINFSGAARDHEDLTEEGICQALDATLLHVLRDNPRVTRWLLEP